MHVAVKENRSSRPANQLAINSLEPLYQHNVSTGKIIELNDVATSLALLLSTADCDDITADIIIIDPSSWLNDVATSLALLLSTADCDDITADIIIIDPSSCLLILLTS
ncbi:hypothetical protein F511_12442 [Dorcoceras hygrometricum]|uniref:Uncharacterized protein n=1 Tax=Dorcoceras hygrometricum TaxID=472368 RepID=A0A2Z7DHD7_9LAMI|nr:hypothetical protein F511_12442 [Dorcoceras hygrometricum]